jgi:hypothetical protein
MTKEYITFGDNGKGRVLSVGTVKVSESVTLRCVSLVKSLGYNLLYVSQLLDEGFEVHFKTGCSRVLDSRGDLVCTIVPRVKFSEPIFLSVLALLVVWLLVFRRSFGNVIGRDGNGFKPAGFCHPKPMPANINYAREQTHDP